MLTDGGLNWNVMSLAETGALAAVVLILGLFVVRPVLLSGRRPPLLPEPVALEAPIDERPVEGEAIEPVERLQLLIAERKSDAVKLLQSWSQTSAEEGKA